MSTAAAAYNPTAFQQVVLLLLHRYFARTGRQWSYISQEWMLEKLEKWHGMKRSRRALGYALADLERAGLISRLQRHERAKDTGKFTPQVTMHRLTAGLRSWIKRQMRMMRGAAPAAAAGAGRRSLLERIGGAARRPVPCECGHMIDKDQRHGWACSSCGAVYDDAAAIRLDQERGRMLQEQKQQQPPAPAMSAAEILAGFKRFKTL